MGSISYTFAEKGLPKQTNWLAFITFSELVDAPGT